MPRLLLSTLLVLSAACASTRPLIFRSAPGPVGVAFAPPAGFALSSAFNLNDDLLVGPPGSLQIIRVTDLPLPLSDEAISITGDGSQLDQATVDAWGARFSRDPSVKLVAARSLFWDRNRSIGAVEVSYTDKDPGALGMETVDVTRVAFVVTNKGICTISLFCLAGFGKQGEKVWAELLDGISVGPGAERGHGQASGEPRV